MNGGQKLLPKFSNDPSAASSECDVKCRRRESKYSAARFVKVTIRSGAN